MPLRHYIDLSMVKDEKQEELPARQPSFGDLVRAQQQREEIASSSWRSDARNRPARQRAEALGLVFDGESAERPHVHEDAERDEHARQLARRAEQPTVSFRRGPPAAPPSFAQLEAEEHGTENGMQVLQRARDQEEDTFLDELEQCPYQGDLTEPVRGDSGNETRAADVVVAAPAEVQGAKKKKRSLEECQEDLDENRKEVSKNYVDDFARFVEFCRDCLDTKIPANKWMHSIEGFGVKRMLPPFSLVILKKFSAWLLANYSRASLVQYRYAINYMYEQAGLGRPWLNKQDGGVGYRIFDKEMKDYAALRAQYDSQDGKKRARGGAKRVSEDGVRCLLLLAEKRAAVVVDNDGRTINMKSQVEQESDLALFGHSMLILTMIVCVLRSCSTVWPPDLSSYLSFSPAGTMRLLVFFWKETSQHPGEEEPEQIQIPWATTDDEDTHPRNRYLSLMRILLDKGGTMSFVKNEAASQCFEGSITNKQARTRNHAAKAAQEPGVSGRKLETAVSSQIGEMALSAWGGKEAISRIDPSLVITGHTMRKTGASAALNTGASESLVVKLGMWSEKSGVPKAYKQPSYSVSRFFLQLFDWLRS